MLAYYLLFFSVSILCLFYELSKKNFFLRSAFFLLFLFSAFRYKVGIDYVAYEQMLEKVRIGDLNGVSSEIGFRAILNFINNINGSSQLIFLIFALVTQYFFFLYINRSSKNKLLSTLVYLSLGTFYLASLSGIRQFAGIATFLFALRYIEKKNLKKYLLIMILGAVYFHYTLIILIPFYFLLKLRVSKFQMIMIIISEFIFGKLIIFIIKWSPYSIYLDMKFNDEISPTVYIFLLLSVIFVFLLSNYKLEKETLVAKNMLFYSVCITLLLFVDKLYSPEIVLRINNYFLAGLIILIPDIFNNIYIELKNKYIGYIMYLSIIIFLLSYYIRTVSLTGQQYNLVPYMVNMKIFK